MDDGEIVIWFEMNNYKMKIDTRKKNVGKKIEK
jgi:hypothetical protein